ncbi:hypothetical protein [Streptomyces durhamensis]|uniref:hypothetical protein n=1 Tax=Streptomyces durhamensis TaxID=68194 RepID=UPI0012FEA38D|nr:hypothetical protein [Streptomyces durhamensis]
MAHGQGSLSQDNTQVHDDSPLTRLDMMRFARRVVEQQTVRQLALIDRWIADEEPREYEQRRGQERLEAFVPVPGALRGRTACA